MAIGTPTSIGTKSDRTAGTDCVITGVTASSGMILVAAGCGTNGLTATVFDSVGNTYAVDVTSNGGAGGAAVFIIASAQVTTPLSAGTITVRWSSSVAAGSGNNKSAAAANVTGLATSTPLDKSSTGNSGTATWDSGATAATTQADELVWGGGFANASTDGASTPTAPNTELQDFNTGSGDGFTLTTVYQILAATGTPKANGAFTGTGSTITVSAVATYKGAGGGPAFMPSRPAAALNAVRTAANW